MKKKTALLFAVLLGAIILLGCVMFYIQKPSKQGIRINLFFETGVEEEKKTKLIQDIKGTVLEEVESVNLYVVEIKGITRKDGEAICKNLELEDIVKAATLADDVPVHTD